MTTILRRRGVDGVPGKLDRERPHTTDWEGACLFTQTCGLPLFTTARDHFIVLGTPAYAADGCERELHRSFVVVRAASDFAELEDLCGRRFAINEADSNSGMNLPRRLFAPLARDGRFFEDTITTGSHAASADLVTRGGADAAAIDCVTFVLLQRYRPEAVDSLLVIARTASTPAPPFVTSRFTATSTVATLRAALAEFATDPKFGPVRESLLLSAIVTTDERDYGVVLDYERDAIASAIRFCAERPHCRCYGSPSTVDGAVLDERDALVYPSSCSCSCSCSSLRWALGAAPWKPAAHVRTVKRARRRGGSHPRVR